jgi:hypothetical protein
MDPQAMNHLVHRKMNNWSKYPHTAKSFKKEPAVPAAGEM